MFITWILTGVDENDNKPEPNDASHDNVDDFSEDTCEVCLYRVIFNDFDKVWASFTYEKASLELKIGGKISVKYISI